MLQCNIPVVIMFFSRVLTPDNLEGRMIEKSLTIFILLKYHRLSPYLDLDIYKSK